MNRTFPHSTNVAAMQYDEASEALTVEFKDGSEYVLSSVPSWAAQGLHDSPSPGSYYHRHLKDRYSTRRL